MSGCVSQMNGLVVRHPTYGNGVVMGEDKYGRLIVKLAGGHQVNSINKTAVKTLSEEEVFNTDVFKGLNKSGMIAYVRTPYSKSSLTEGEAGPWACKKCFQTFDPDLPQINFDKGEKGFYDRKNLICPKCGSNDVKYLGDGDDKADQYGSGHDYNPAEIQGVVKDYAYRMEDVGIERDLPVVGILESIVEEMTLDESSVGHELARSGRMRTEGIRGLIKQDVLKKSDLFAMPKFIREGKELWGKAVDTVWQSGKILEQTGKPNYGAVVNVWKSLYKKEHGEYPRTNGKGDLAVFFESQGNKMAKLLQKIQTESSRDFGNGSGGRKDRSKGEGYLQALASEIAEIRGSVSEDSTCDYDKIDDILEKIESRSFDRLSESRFSRKSGRK